jgi:beta-glucosidase
MKQHSKDKEIKKFPVGFFWGAATASYQVEGYNENCDWAKAAHSGKVPPAGRLADHYHRFEEDFDIAQKLGHNAHRFSIEWGRIEPREGVFDEDEIEHYRAVLRALHKRGITPFITLWHFTLPLWLSSTGGFERPDIATIFARYCSKLAASFGDLCIYYSTINEPNVYATHAYLYGAWPPFKRAKVFLKKIGKEDGTSERTKAVASMKNIFAYLKVVDNLASAHNAAYDAIKKANPKAIVSVVKHVHTFEHNGRLFNRLKAAIMIHFQTYAFMNKVQHKLDWIGLNYYRHTRYGEIMNYLQTDMGWNMNPSGIYGALKILDRYKKPIIIAEAGIADQSDTFRAHYIRLQVEAVYKALQDGIDVRGHMYWSLMDNYEWALGTEKRFGLVEIDYDTLKRTIRPSAHYYKKIIEKNAIL